MPLSLNFTTLGIVAGLKITAAKFVSAFTQVQTYINTLETSIADAVDGLEAEITADIADLADLKNGTDVLGRLNLGPTTTLTLDGSDNITVTQSRHRVDTNGGAASDNLVKINGVLSGGILILQSTDPARVVTIKHNIDNIYNISQADVVLSRPEFLYLALYDLTLAKWVGGVIGAGGLKIQEMLNTTTVAVSSLSVPDKSIIQTGRGAPFLDVQPSFSRRSFMVLRSTGGNFSSACCTFTQIGAWNGGSGTSTFFTRMESGTTISNVGGVRTNEQVRPSYNPIIRGRIANNGIHIANSTAYIGLVGRAVSATTPITATDILVALRIQNTAGASGTANIAIIAGNAAAPTTTAITTLPSLDVELDFCLRFDGALNKVFVSINDGAETEHSTTMPAAGQSMYPHAIIVNNTTTNVYLTLARLDISFN